MGSEGGAIGGLELMPTQSNGPSTLNARAAIKPSPVAQLTASCSVPAYRVRSDSCQCSDESLGSVLPDGGTVSVATDPRLIIATDADMDRISSQPALASLLPLKRWVMYDGRPRENDPEKVSKAPLMCNGAAASSNRPRTWATFTQVAAAAPSSDVAGGVGINLADVEAGEDIGLLCLDIDHGLLDDKPTEPVLGLLAKLPTTYIEISPGGDGLHILLFTKRPDSFRNQTLKDVFGSGTALEVFDGRTTGRYVTVTGRVFEDNDHEIAHMEPEQLAEVLKPYLERHNQNRNAKLSTATTQRKGELFNEHGGGSDLARARYVLDHVFLDPDAGGRDWWLDIVMALASLGPDGEQLALTWSRRGALFSESTDCTEAHFRGFNGSRGIGSLFQAADEHGYGWRDDFEAQDPECQAKARQDKEFAESFHANGRESKAKEAREEQEQQQGKRDSGCPFPIHVFPQCVQDMITEGAKTMAVSNEYLACHVPAIVATAIGSKWIARVKDGFDQPGTIWHAAIATPGSNKSAPFKALLSPLRSLDKTLVARWADAHNAWAAMENGKQGDRPPQLSLLVDDSTIESLVTILEDNPHGLGMMRDEVTGWIQDMDKYRGGKGGDLVKWLAMWDGTPIKITRKTDRTLTHLENPLVSISGTIQPGVAEKCFSDKTESGFASRILTSRLPPCPVRLTRDTISEATSKGWSGMVLHIFNAKPKNGAFYPKGFPVKFDDEAFDVYQAWVEGPMAKRFAAYDKSGDDARASVNAKLRTYAIRFALGLAVMRASEGGLDHLCTLRTINAEDVKAAILMAEWWRDQSAAVYGQWNGIGQQETSDKRRVVVLAILTSEPKTTTTIAKEAGLNHKNALTALGALAADGMASSKPKGKGLVWMVA